MKKYILYLVQGQANLVQSYLDLYGRVSSDAIYLTYDKPMEGAIYFPNSTWSEGRNRLLKESLHIALAQDKSYISQEIVISVLKRITTKDSVDYTM